MRKFVFILAALSLLAFPALSYGQVAIPGPGDVAPQPDGGILTGINLWIFLVLGPLVQAAMYVVNKKAPFLNTEPKKLFATALVAAVAGALYDALFSPGPIQLNDQLLNSIGQAIAAVFAAHSVYKFGGVNLLLGGGVNADGTVTDPNRR